MTKTIRRLVTTIAILAGVSSIALSCGIPTEDQPQPLNQEQTTTTVTSSP
jgi:hypothetical protein